MDRVPSGPRLDDAEDVRCPPAHGFGLELAVIAAEVVGGDAADDVAEDTLSGKEVCEAGVQQAGVHRGPEIMQHPRLQRRLALLVEPGVDRLVELALAVGIGEDGMLAIGRSSHRLRSGSRRACSISRGGRYTSWARPVL